ncbi:MAG: A24 family peptidase [Nanoarchaeota archaeon]|nr:A24 family peptidase [Nanoarchaeota archaeon]MCG2717625.1 A24 family peptidase [Nanoarchaeota archaeon]
MILSDMLLMIIGFVALIFASVHDLKTREVPDWLSYSLIISGFGIRLIYSLLFLDFWYIGYGLIGFIIMVIIGLIMYYTKQWGGGDAKLIMGLGVVFASSPFNGENFLIGFWINILIIGALYGLFWSIFLAIRNWKDFVKEFKKMLIKKRLIRRIASGLGIVIIISIFLIDLFYLKFILAIVGLFFIVYSYIVTFVKAVENACMYKWLTVAKLTEGDWVAKPVYVNKKLICGPKDLGLEMDQIKALKKANVKKVYIKEGIPFVPSFLLAAIFTLIFGNVIFLF